MRAPDLHVQELERRRLLSAAASPLAVDGIAVLGDSYSDEYQFYPRDRATAANWVEQLAEDTAADFGPFSATDPAGPRNAGYAYNFAVSGATSTDMIAAGQHTAAAAQAAAGAVDLATIFIGGNDFLGAFGALLTRGPDAAAAAVLAAIPTVLRNVFTATETMLNASPDVNVVLTTIPRLSHLPVSRAVVGLLPPLAPLIAGMDAAVGIINEVMKRAAATSDRVAVADFARLSDDIFAAGALQVGGVSIDLGTIVNFANDPRRLFLADFVHSGTVAQGLFANLVVRTANEAFGTALEGLSDGDILQNAGIAPAVTAAPVTGNDRQLFGDSPIADARTNDAEDAGDLLAPAAAG